VRGGRSGAALGRAAILAAMRTGLFVGTVNPIVTPEYLHTLAAAASERGFCSIWVGEHVVQFGEYRPDYPYSSDGRITLGDGMGLLEPFCTLSFLAAASRDLRLGTGVCLLPQRNPVYTAKSVSTLDWLSGGRVDFGIGIGWCREEYEALQVPFERRAARCSEYVEVMRRLWRDDEASFEGDFYRLVPSRMDPKPLQRPHPPLYFGGESDAAMRRVARMGDGWHGFNVAPEEAGGLVERLEAVLADSGRSLSDVEVTISPYLHPVGPEEARRYRDAGVDQLVLFAPLEEPSGLPGALDRICREVQIT
jgi:probable F420-dependent oxidoreductase